MNRKLCLAIILSIAASTVTGLFIDLPKKIDKLKKRETLLRMTAEQYEDNDLDTLAAIVQKYANQFDTLTTVFRMTEILGEKNIDFDVYRAFLNLEDKCEHIYPDLIDEQSLLDQLKYAAIMKAARDGAFKHNDHEEIVRLLSMVKETIAMEAVPGTDLDPYYRELYSVAEKHMFLDADTKMYCKKYQTLYLILETIGGHYKEQADSLKENIDELLRFAQQAEHFFPIDSANKVDQIYDTLFRNVHNFQRAKTGIDNILFNSL